MREPSHPEGECDSKAECQAISDAAWDAFKELVRRLKHPSDVMTALSVAMAECYGSVETSDCDPESFAEDVKSYLIRLLKKPHLDTQKGDIQ